VVSETNGGNLNNVTCKAIRQFRNKKREYLRDKINELASNIKNETISNVYRKTNELTMGYKTRNNLHSKGF
jgi:mRNA-degrading endonuclease RelE of RelBE toxin-antitoxin system